MVETIITSRKLKLASSGIEEEKSDKESTKQENIREFHFGLFLNYPSEVRNQGKKRHVYIDTLYLKFY